MFRLCGWVIFGILVLATLVNVSSNRDPCEHFLDFVLHGSMAAWVLWALLR